MSFTRQEWVGSAVGGVFRSTQGGPEVALQFLPPSGATKRRCVLETRVGYVRSASGFDAPSPTDHRNTVSVGAALRLVFPGVTSLKQLARHY
jgi:hypothetical protein